MIIELRTKTPFIHYGFHNIKRKAIVGEVVDIYLKTSYNQNSYDEFKLIAFSSSSLVKISDYHYKVTYDTDGLKQITSEVKNKGQKELNSNILELEIIPVTVDNTRIKADNNIITADTL